MNIFTLFSLPLLSSSERVEKGQLVHRIQHRSEAGPDGGTEATVLSLVPARVLGVHREAGTEPYFTVELTDASGTSTGRELQTEWHRCGALA